MSGSAPIRRRELVVRLASTGGLALLSCATPGGAGPKPDARDKEAEVTPGEDLMQEHGVLERVLLVYEEAASRIERSDKLDPAIVSKGAQLIRRFIAGYHEKLEEKFVFPRLQKASREVALVATLLRQHEAGRAVTEAIIKLSQAAPGRELAAELRKFTRMYRPHAAREDTVLFPAFREVVGRDGYRELGEQFEDEEHQRFGPHGFEDAVAEVGRLEAALGIADLAAFTPT